MGNEKQLVKKSAIERMAGRLQVSKDVLEKTLKATVCKGVKQQNGSYKPITNEEFVSFIAVANNYKLNPLTKEIYAYPDTKSAGIIPIVATDGWNKLMTTHPNYKTHYYRQAEEMVKPTEVAKSCPVWMEIIIVKKDDSEVVVREYLDECYNGGKKYKDGNPISSPWDSHTKRMLRHKTKIQGAREAFGFGGIYDQDEGERIIEAHLVEDPQLTGKPEVEQPQSLSENTEPEPKPEPEKKGKPSGAPKIEHPQDQEDKLAESGSETEKEEKNVSEYFTLLAKCRELKKDVGKKTYYEVIGSLGFSKSNEMKSPELKEFIKALEEMKAEQATKDSGEKREPGQEG